MVGRFDDSVKGVTLIELLVVLSILTMVLGMSVSVFRSFGEGQTLEVAASQVSTAVRAARNWSISTGMPSRVLVDPDARKVTAYGFSTVAAWDFEDLSGETPQQPLPDNLAVEGAFRQQARVTGHVEAGEGSVGTGLFCINDGAALQAEWLPRYDVHRGFSVEAWVQFWQPPWNQEDGIEPTGGFSDPRRDMRMAIMSLPGSFEVGLLGDGAVYLEVGDPDGDIDASFFRAQSESGRIFPDRWTHVRAAFDGVSIALEVDGVAVDWFPEGFEWIVEEDWPPFPQIIPRVDSDLYISHPARFFMGGIDQVVLRSATDPQVVELPIDIELLGPPQLIYLSGNGSLNPLEHDLPVVIHIAEVGDLAEVEMIDGTAVAKESFRDQMKRKKKEREEEQAKVEEAFGSPIGDLMSYLEDWQSESEEEGEVEDVYLLPLTPGQHFGIGEVDEHKVLRLHNVVVDLTGAIRG
ncbi:MAG: hypothetical protein CBC13_00860 [Planctomycetia bacterium TMED53]|nr:MAG: hypothetical protein CBC13_00860 [Planctomycetia bacterium TMED53]